MLALRIFNSYNKLYKIHLIDASTTPTPTPKLTFNAKVELSMQTLKEILDDIDVVADYITIEADQSKISFNGKGDLGEASIDIEANDEFRIKGFEVKEQSKATYSLEYLKDITKAIGSSAERVVLEFSNAMPIRLEFKIEKIGKMHFYLAPRVEQ